MTALYSLRSTPTKDEYLILKLSSDFEPEGTYALNARNCSCPAGHRPLCKHRKMLPFFLDKAHVDDGWFLDWDTRLWKHPINPEQGLADSTLLGQSEEDRLASALAPAFTSEASIPTIAGASVAPTPQASAPSGPKSGAEAPLKRRKII